MHDGTIQIADSRPVTRSVGAALRNEANRGGVRARDEVAASQARAVVTSDYVTSGGARPAVPHRLITSGNTGAQLYHAPDAAVEQPREPELQPLQVQTFVKDIAALKKELGDARHELDAQSAELVQSASRIERLEAANAAFEKALSAAQADIRVLQSHLTHRTPPHSPHKVAEPLSPGALIPNMTLAQFGSPRNSSFHPMQG